MWASIEFAWLLKLCTFAQFDIVNFSSFRSFILNCIYLHWSVTESSGVDWNIENGDICYDVVSDSVHKARPLC